MSLRFEKHHSHPFTYRNSKNNNSVSRTHILTSQNDQRIFTSLLELLRLIKANPHFLTDGIYEPYRWSFFEQFGLDPYSVLLSKTAFENIKHMFKRFNYRHLPRALFRGNPGENILDQIYGTPSNSSRFTIPDSQEHNLYLFIYESAPLIGSNYTDYKIHFSVKEEYALYVLIKSMKVLLDRNNALGRKERLGGKIILDLNRTKYPVSSEKESYWFGGNTVPTVVIYPITHVAAHVKDIIERLIAAFPEYKSIGLMTEGQPEMIPYGNVRVNDLICYAQGDRGIKLEKKRHNYGFYEPVSKVIKSIDTAKYNIITSANGTLDYKLKGTTTHSALPTEVGLPFVNVPPEHKHIPVWVNNMLSACDADAAKRSVQFFGLNMCSPHMTANIKCKSEPFCYLTYNSDMLDPNTIRGIEGLPPSERFSQPSQAQSPLPLGVLCKDALEMGKRLQQSLAYIDKKYEPLIIKTLLEDCNSSKETLLQNLRPIVATLEPVETRLKTIMTDTFSNTSLNINTVINISDISILSSLVKTLANVASVPIYAGHAELRSAYSKLYRLEVSITDMLILIKRKLDVFNGGGRKPSKSKTRKTRKTRNIRKFSVLPTRIG